MSTTATAALDEMIKSKASPASAALGSLSKSSPASASLCKLEPLINLSATSVALEGMMKAKSPTTASASLALSGLMTAASPATAALDEMLKASASAALEDDDPFNFSLNSLHDSMNESSRKRVKKMPHETPRRASMTSFSKPAKFDTTDLFQALQGSDTKAGCDFPTLSWVDDHDDEEEDAAADFDLSAGSGERRRSLSAFCLLGKRPRTGGLVRSKTMKSQVDRLVLQHQTAFPCHA